MQSISLIRILATTCFTIIVCCGYGQSPEKSGSLSPLSKFDIGVQGVGYTYEARLGGRITSDLSAGIGAGYDISEDLVAVRFDEPAVYLSVTPKYFLNIQQRTAKGKNTSMNSADYLGIRLKYSTPIAGAMATVRNSLLFNIHWGMQRQISQKWLFSAHAGAGYAQDIDMNFGTLYPAGEFRFSYVFTKNK